MSIKAPKERDLVKQCLLFLRFNCYHVWRQNSGAAKIGKRLVRFTTMPGISDIIGWAHDGRFLAIECKRKGQKPTASQACFLESLNRAGGVGLLVHSLDELIEGLKQRNNHAKEI